jgi:hypothetical protein
VGYDSIDLDGKTAQIRTLYTITTKEVVRTTSCFFDQYNVEISAQAKSDITWDGSNFSINHPQTIETNYDAADGQDLTLTCRASIDGGNFEYSFYGPCMVLSSFNSDDYLLPAP